MTNKTELMPCPFCKGEPILEEIGNDHTKKRSVTIKCKSCRVKLTNAALKHPMQWLIDVSISQWNTRSCIEEIEGLKVDVDPYFDDSGNAYNQAIDDVLNILRGEGCQI